MKSHILMSLIVTGLLPAIVISFLYYQIDRKDITTEVISDTGQATIEHSAALTENIKGLQVRVETDAGIVKMNLEAYITGVVLGEMPSDFELEALKSQAVVARTYTCKKMTSPKHVDADVCTNSLCCQAYISKESFLNKGGTEESLKRVTEAVNATYGEVLTYNGELIEATYFSCSGGKTETAKAVWGGDIPYLQSVDSPGEEIASHYMDTVKFSAAEFANLLGFNPDGSPEKWISDITYTEGGGVESIVISGNLYSGVEFRKLLNLRSTAFVITAVRDNITITTKGFGHRVGMSQYGAEAMALDGKDYETILSHYYQGAVLTSIFG